MAPPVFQHPVHINIYLPRAPGVEKKFTRPRAAQTLGPTSTPPNNWLEDASQKNEKHTYTHTLTSCFFGQAGRIQVLRTPPFSGQQGLFSTQRKCFNVVFGQRYGRMLLARLGENPRCFDEATRRFLTTYTKSSLIGKKRREREREKKTSRNRGRRKN